MPLFYLFRAHITLQKNRKKNRTKQNKIERHSRKSTSDQGATNRSKYQQLHVETRELLSLTREIRHGASRPDPNEIRVSRVNRHVSGRVGLSPEVFEISRVGSGRAYNFSNLVGRVGSSQDMFKFLRVGSGQVTYPTRRVRFDLTREKP